MNDRNEMRGLVFVAELKACERVEGKPVELWANNAGELLIRAYNEGGYSFTEIPILQVIEELKRTNFEA